MFEIVIGGFLFWTLIVAFIIACEFSTVNENHWGFGWLLVLLAAFTWGSTFNPGLWVWHNPGSTLVWASIYLGIGVCWGFAKWWFHLHNELDRIKDNNELWRTRYNSATNRSSGISFTGTFVEYLESEKMISRAINNKNLISVWMLWWPFSLAWTSLHDVLRRFYNMLIEKYLFLFDKINNAVFGSLNK